MTTLNLTNKDTVEIHIWNYLDTNPGKTLDNITDILYKERKYLPSTVKTALYHMNISGILIKTTDNKIKTFKVNDVFPDANKAFLYLYNFKRCSYITDYDIKIISYTDNVKNKIENLRMEIFVSTGQFLSNDSLINHLFDNKKIFENEYAKKVESLVNDYAVMEKTMISGYIDKERELVLEYQNKGNFKNKELPITLIEKETLIQKFFNFFKSMKNSYS